MTDTTKLKLGQLSSLSALMAEYRPSMDKDVLHSWAKDILSAVIVEKARISLKQRYPGIDDERLVEIEDENQLSWRICLKTAVDSLPLNNIATAALLEPLPELYEEVHQKHNETLVDGADKSDIIAGNDLIDKRKAIFDLVQNNYKDWCDKISPDGQMTEKELADRYVEKESPLVYVR